MTKPVFVADQLDGAGAEFVLDGAEGRHAVSVKRLRPGEGVVLTDGRGGWLDLVLVDPGHHIRRANPNARAETRSTQLAAPDRPVDRPAAESAPPCHLLGREQRVCVGRRSNNSASVTRFARHCSLRSSR